MIQKMAELTTKAMTMCDRSRATQAEDILQEGHVDERELQEDGEEHRAQEQPVGEQPGPEERFALETDGHDVEHLRDGQHGEEHRLPGFVARLPVDPPGQQERSAPSGGRPT